MIDNCNINNLAKNQVSAISIRALFAEVWSTQIFRALYGDAMLVFIRMGTNLAAGNQRKPTETSVTEFCYKSVNLSLEELKNNTVLLFPMQELFR